MVKMWGLLLLLFDIDGTLLSTNGAGKRAMELAGRRLYDPRFTVADVEFTGRLDSEVWRQLIAPSRLDLHTLSGSA
jgi:phosphoglycolate phosphatase-like HAD superfamily hydrolase